MFRQREAELITRISQLESQLTRAQAKNVILSRKNERHAAEMHKALEALKHLAAAANDVTFDMDTKETDEDISANQNRGK